MTGALIKCWYVARRLVAPAGTRRAAQPAVHAIPGPRRILTTPAPSRAAWTAPRRLASVLVCVQAGSMALPAQIAAPNVGALLPSYGAGYAPGAALAWLPTRGSVLDGPAGLSGAVVPVVALAGPVTAAQPVPEPAGVWVLLAGMLALVGVGRRA